MFLICDFRGDSAAEILFIPKSLRGYFEAGGTPRQGLAAFTADGAGTAGRGTVEILNDQGGNVLSVERTNISSTLRSQTHGNLPVIVMATGQAKSEILGNLFPTLTVRHEQPFFVHPKIAGTLCASAAGLDRPAGMKSETDFCIVSAGFRYKAGSKAGSTGYQEETAPTLIAEQPSGVFSAYAIDCRNLRELPEVSETLKAKSNSGDYSLNYQNPVRIGFELRRLMPVEAERLMGFPDFWTERDLDGRIISDTKRYQMLGNSIAVPCAAYIMQGIRQVL